MKKVLCVWLILACLSGAALADDDGTPRICPNCGAEVTTAFCGSCGTRMPDESDWICPSCSAQATRNFCGQCGASRPTPEPEPEVTPVPPGGMIGQIVTFGRYEQDYNGQNGPEDIEWIVLDEKDGYYLLISRYALERMPYHYVTDERITWEKSDLRNWLNNRFVRNAFTEEEMSRIRITRVSNEFAEGNPLYRFNEWSGNNTDDRVFLLSYREAWYYFPTDESRRCMPTESARRSGVETENGFCWWWLRSRGFNSNGEAAVNFDGSSRSDSNGYGVAGTRPALWVETGAVR